MKQWHILAIIGGLLLLLTVWKRKDLISMVSGVIDTPPEIIAKADGVPVEVESLARAMYSEESAKQARIAIGWAIKNYAKKQGKSITSVVTASKGTANGKYSKQDVKGGKYCTTFKSPDRATLQLASEIISGSIRDPTNGAIQWDAPKAQAALHAKDPVKFKSPETIAANRQREGRRLVMVADVPNTRFWA
jgi:hypothetical protein